MVWSCVVYRLAWLKLQSGRPPSSHLILTCWDTAVSALPSPASPLQFCSASCYGQHDLEFKYPPTWSESPGFHDSGPFSKKNNLSSKLSQHVSTVWQTPLFLLKPASNDLESYNVFLLEGILNIITFPTVCSALKKKQQLCINTNTPPKFNVEPKHMPLEQEIFPFGNYHFQVPCYFFWK